MSPQVKSYYGSSIEAPVHLIQYGRNKGVKLGDPYPGDKAFDELISDEIGGAAYYMKRNTSKDKRRM